MNSDTRILQLLSLGIEKKIFPGAAVGFITKSGLQHNFAAGHHTYDTRSPVTTAQTLFDVASVTKTFSTTSLALLLEKAGIWNLQDPLLQWLPNWKGEPAITLDDLVSFRPEFALTLSQHKTKNAQELIEIICSAPLASPLGTKPPIYSNATSLLLSFAIEHASGKSLTGTTQNQILTPQGLSRTTFTPLNTFDKTQIAPTEHDLWRNELIHGKVHDESAWQLQQAGHDTGSAGLFSTVEDCLTFLHWRLNDLPDTRGWEGYSPEWMGAALSPQSYGKTGFTGCLLAIDPLLQTGFVILSNAVHPQRPIDREPLQAFRREMLSVLASVSGEHAK